MSVQSQHVTLRGNVKDSLSQEGLEDATVSLFAGTKHEIAGRVRNREGFQFSALKKGSYLLVVSNQGYADDSLRFIVSAKDSGIIVHNILMQRAAGKLLEVVVRASIPPVIVKNDTIAFNAAAYPSPPNSTVEDLLRKLPGVQVDKDGNVTMNGRPVDKITIDGKDFFLNDPKLATQNLPADIVAQVEAFDTQSEKARLTGIHEQSASKTINIKLKKNRKKGYFGKAYAAGGAGGGYPDGGYSAGAGVTRLAGEQMILLDANANNINSQFVGIENQNGGGAGLASVNDQRFNFRDKFGKNFTANLSAARNYNNSSVDQQLSRQTVLTDSSITQNSLTSSRNRNSNISAAVYLQWAVDSMTELNLRSNFGTQKTFNESLDTTAITTQKGSNNYLSSIGRTDNSSNGSGNNFNNSLDFRRLFQKKGRVLYMNLSQTSSAQNLPATLYSLVRSFDSAGNTLSNMMQNQQSVQVTKNNGYSVGASYTEPIGKRHVLDFNYGFSQSTGHSDKESFDYDSATMKYDHLDTLTTNRFLNQTTTQNWSAGYNTTEGKYRFQIGLAGQLVELANKNQFSDSTLRQETLNWFPKATLLWEIEKGKNMNFSYSGSNTPPSIDQLQPIPDLTNPYLIKIGNPDLKQSFTHGFSANYSSYSEKNFQNWQVSMSGSYAQNQITSSSTVLPGGVQELQYVNVDGVFHLSSYLTYGFPLGNQKFGNASLSLSGNYGHDISLINGAENIASNSGIAGSLNVNFHVKDSLFIRLNANVNAGYSSYSLPGSPSSETLNENYTLDFNYRLPASFVVASFYSLQITGSQNALPAHAVSRWNATVYKTVLKNRGEIRFSAFDILNSSSSFSQSTGVNFVQTQKTNVPGRLLLLSLVWRFKYFGEGKAG